MFRVTHNNLSYEINKGVVEVSSYFEAIAQCGDDDDLFVLYPSSDKCFSLMVKFSNTLEPTSDSDLKILDADFRDPDASPLVLFELFGLSYFLEFPRLTDVCSTYMRAGYLPLRCLSNTESLEVSKIRNFIDTQWKEEESPLVDDVPFAESLKVSRTWNFIDTQWKEEEIPLVDDVPLKARDDAIIGLVHLWEPHEWIFDDTQFHVGI